MELTCRSCWAIGVSRWFVVGIRLARMRKTMNTEESMRIIATAFTLTASLSSFAGDIAVTSVEINQGGQFGTTTLVGGRPTMVRVKIAVTGQTTAQANVDAVLRVYSGGVQIAGSPYFSRNGPISAPISPNSLNLNDTLNFTIVAPVSTDVDFQVVVDPRNLVAETNETNNLYSLNNKVFACRKTLDVAYVSINYTIGGGQPVAATIEPGIGDGFMRGIYAMAELNYHRSPLGPLNWTTDINSSDGVLLSTLQTIRMTTIPAAGYARPEFIYGWLPGNPFSGNGEASGIPGDAAFGNTESSRFQRTFAHEIGHCWGRSHTGNTIASVGFDVEHNLASPLNLGQPHATSQYDVMVAGQLTNVAWVDSGTYNDCLTDTRSQCSAFNPPGGGEELASDAQRVLQFTGSYEHREGRIELFPVNQLDLASPTIDDPRGDLLMQSFDAQGGLLTSVRWRSATTRESCEACVKGKPHLHDHSFVSLLIPATVGNQQPHRIELRDLASGRLLAKRVRTPSSPQIVRVGSRIIDGIGVASHTGAGPFIEIFWDANDADGDALSTDVLLSRDGGQSWSAIGVNQRSSSVRLSLADIPVALEGEGIVKVRVSDGLNVIDREMPTAIGVFGVGGADEGSVAGDSAWSSFQGENPPDVHMISPNANQSYPAGASILLHASGWDLEDQFMANNAFTWTSSIGGAIGTGRQILVASLPAGSHTIRLRGTDLSGLFVEKAALITVTARSLFNPDVNGSGAVDGVDLSTLLSNWGIDGVGDLNFDGIVNGGDLTILLTGWTT
ncbi:MAG: hypothetical protein EXS15_05490 [Phycisphaerales bacterium]|nr:hypothetical protein [Phycisphaerales bacterium]